MNESLPTHYLNPYSRLFQKYLLKQPDLFQGPSFSFIV
ncbi:hypothetical protein EVA_21022 [gut metagenome]|uniref:Uncharacterized protein n=1 Tax=gut metagenome TaxID=749906 RepID=J9FMM4_9ZZZZ